MYFIDKLKGIGQQAYIGPFPKLILLTETKVKG